MNDMKEKTIIVTGGHQGPAIAVIEEIRKKYPSWHIVWIGRKYSFEGSRVVSPEYELVRSMDIPFESLTTGRLDRSMSAQSFFSFLKIPLGIMQSVRMLRDRQPDCIVSFGGYIAVPVCLAAYLLHIPVITHEQTHALGLANSMIARIARKICVTYPETLSVVPGGKGVLTGLPIRSRIFSPPVRPSFAVPNDPLPILYVTGGSTGAKTLNEKMYAVIPRFIKDMILIHQTGDSSFSEAKILKESLGDHAGRYIIAPFFDVSDIAWIYVHADVVVGRSGANTVAEVSAFRKKAVFIPLPWSGGNEQMVNARHYQKTGNGILLKQADATKASLTDAVYTLLARRKHESQGDIPRSDGAANMVKEIDSLLSPV